MQSYSVIVNLVRTWIDNLKKETLTKDEIEQVKDTNTTRQHVSGDDVIFHVPDDMRKIRVQLQEDNGRIKEEYTLTDFLRILPGERIRIRIIK